MPRKVEFHAGMVFVKLMPDGRWRASWTDPVTRRHVRRVLPSATYEEAREAAKGINRDVSAGRRYNVKLRGKSGHSVSEAAMEAIRHTDARPETRAEYGKRFNQFLKFCEEEVAGVRCWGDVTEAVLGKYLEHCRRAGIAFDTLRQRVYAIKVVARHMNETYPEQYPRDVARVLRIKRPMPVEQGEDEDGEGGAILTAGALRTLLAWLREHEPMVHCWAAMQGLGGLRGREALYLRRCDVDLKAGTVRIAPRSVHGLKNRHSARTLPVAETVKAALAGWIEGLKIQHVGEGEDYLFLNALGKPIGPDYASGLMRAALDRAAADGVTLPEGFVARRLRATFFTAMREAGADMGELQAYAGHAQSTVLGAHYDKIGLERLRKLATLAEELATATGRFAEGEQGEKRAAAASAGRESKSG